MLSVLSRALLLFVMFLGPALADCTLVNNMSPIEQVVLIDASDAGGPVKGERTGILVTDNGVVLSALRRGDADRDLGTQAMLGHDLATLKVRVRSATTSTDVSVEGLIFGYDARRNLLVIKITPEDVKRLGLKKAPIVGFAATAPDEVCLVGFRREGASVRAQVSDGLVPKLGPDIRWSFRYDKYYEETGSAVLDARTGDLVGIVTEQVDSETRYLPIEYADTVLSQVFLTRIVRELEQLNRTASDLQTTVGWTYQIIETTDGVPTIRFIFEQYARGLVVNQVRITTRLVGTHESEGAGDVKLADPEFGPVILEGGQNYVDYTPVRFLEQATMLGYLSIEAMSVILYVEFKVPDGLKPIQSTRTTYKIPFKITLEAGQ